MTPFEAFAQGHALVLSHPVGGERLVAALWPTNDGIGWAEIGWDTNDSGHPFHRLVGQVAGAGPLWRVAEAEIYELQNWDPLVAQWRRWQDWLRQHPEITPEAARLAAESAK